MTDLTRPEFGEAWASEGEKVAPDSAKMKLGWVREMMPYQYQNYLQARVDESVSYLLQKGIPEYSATQEYIANKSYVSYQGAVYLATQTVTGVLPSVTTSWKRISAISDSSGVVSVAGGGTGATTAAQARTNLGLGTASTLDATYVVQKDANGNFSANIISASLNGNASSADKLKTPRQLKLVGAVESVSASFDGTANLDIVTSKVDATKIEGILSNDTTGTAAEADKWTTPRKVTLSGAVTGVSNLSDGSQDFEVAVGSVNASFLNAGTVPAERLSNAVVKTSATGAAKLPKGSTSERPTSPEFADFRGNTTTSLLEYFNGTSWVNPQAYSSEYVLNRANHTGTQPASTITGLSVGASFTTVPTTNQGPSIVVTSPHLRFMVWDGAKYVRAPWHAPGKLSYFLREVPAGHIEVRSDVVLNASDFPDLAEYLGVTGATFVLDEARGEFLRSLDSGRGVDAGRVLGSAQSDAFKNHTHGAYRVIAAGGLGIAAGDSYGVNPAGALEYEGGSETRPRNIAYRLAVQY